MAKNENASKDSSRTKQQLVIRKSFIVRLLFLTLTRYCTVHFGKDKWDVAAGADAAVLLNERVSFIHLCLHESLYDNAPQTRHLANIAPFVWKASHKLRWFQSTVIEQIGQSTLTFAGERGLDPVPHFQASLI